MTLFAYRKHLPMLRYLPLLFLFVACSDDPLQLHEATIDTVAVADGLKDMTMADNGPVTGKVELLPAHEDLNLNLSFRADAGAKADLLVQGKYAISLPDLAVNGAQPRITPVVSPGVWQDVEIYFIAPQEDAPALLPAVYLNGSLVYYQQPLMGNEAPAGPLTLDVTAGSIELSGLRYSDQAGEVSSVSADGKVVLSMPLVRYEYFDLPEGTTMVTDWASLTPDKTGYLHRFDLEPIHGSDNSYAVRFYGKLQIPQAGEYKFRTFSPATNMVYLDGQKVVDRRNGKDDLNKEGFIKLSEGMHDLRVDFIQNGGWHRFDLGYQAPNGEEGYVNTMEERKTIATPAAAAPRVLETDDYPYLLRSFLYFPTPKVYEAATKRTHVISVGEADGPHYSLDLQTDALLQAWRGGFADTHDMWDGRGEPQVMRPLGQILPFDGTPQWGWLEADDDPWPDTLAKKLAFQHSEHQLDEAGRPTFIYTMTNTNTAMGHSMTDKLIPDNGGLIRELTHSVGGNGTIFTQLAAARKITEIAPGEYELRGPGMTLKIQSYDGDRLVLQHSGNGDRLVAEIPAKGHITYRMDW